MDLIQKHNPITVESSTERHEKEVAGWFKSVLGPTEVLSSFAHEHGNAALWRLEAGKQHVWLKMHARRGAWAAECHALERWGPIVGRTPVLIAFRQAPEAMLISEVNGEAAKSLGWEGAVVEHLWSEAGAWLARLHGLGNGWFGGVEADGSPLGVVDEDSVAFQGTCWEVVLANAGNSGLLNEVELDFAVFAAKRGLESIKGERACATHQDFSPRNWLASPEGQLTGVIDFEHARWDTRAADLCLPYDRDFLRNPRLEAAFVDGYGGLDGWLREQILAFRTMLVTRRAVWAATVGAHEFARENVEALRRQMAG